MKILIVEDFPDIVFLLAEFLTNEGFECQTASTAKEAIALFEQEDFDVMFLDIGLPDADGMDLIPFFKIKKKYVEIIMLTAVSCAKTAIECIRLGASDFLFKPVHFQELIKSINYVTSKNKTYLKEIDNFKSYNKRCNDERGRFINYNKKLRINEINIEKEEIQKLYMIIEHIFSLARHDFGNAIFNSYASLESSRVSVEKIDQLIDNIKDDNSADKDTENTLVCIESIKKVIESSYKINQRSVHRVESLTRVMFGSFDKKDFQSVFISKPYSIVKYLMELYPEVDISIYGQSYKTLEVLFPENVLASILMELINNSKNILPFGLRLEISWKIHQSSITFEMHDNGPGIPGALYGSTPAFLDDLLVKTSGLKIINNIVGCIDGGLFFYKSKRTKGALVKFNIPSKIYYLKGNVHGCK